MKLRGECDRCKGKSDDLQCQDSEYRCASCRGGPWCEGYGGHSERAVAQVALYEPDDTVTYLDLCAECEADAAAFCPDNIKRVRTY